jgi:hypothetical protein
MDETYYALIQRYKLARKAEDEETSDWLLNAILAHLSHSH